MNNLIRQLFGPIFFVSVISTSSVMVDCRVTNFVCNKSPVIPAAVLSTTTVNKTEPSSTPSPIPTYIPRPTSDPDPIVTCKFVNISPLQLRSSVCNSSTECQIGDKWLYYSSVSKCKDDQNALNKPVNTANYVWPTVAPWPTMIPFPTSDISASINAMKAVNSSPLVTQPLDGSIHMDNPNPTPVVPYGFGN